MNLDSHGLPCQSNGDCSDQLQRVGMIGVGNELNPLCKIRIPIYVGLEVLLQPAPGTYTRYTGSSPNNVTADQLIPVLAYWTLTDNTKQSMNMVKTLFKRFGFAQNTHKDNDPTIRTVPDLMIVRALPFILRINRWTYPFLFVCDLLLVIAVIISILQSSADNVDDNNIIVTLAVCQKVMPTPLSWLARKLYKSLRPAPGAAGSLVAYHAASTGGNPEVADLWVPIVKKF